jgi:hypothetical protein
MQKNSRISYPSSKEKQFNFTRGVISMLNARRYLQSQGFSESVQTCGWDRTNINGIAGEKGQITFPDGSVVDSDAFILASSRDSLLERIIETNASFQKLPEYHFNQNRTKVIRCKYSNNGYEAILSLRDTNNYFYTLITSPKLFAFDYDLTLTKDIITENDIKQFEVTLKGIEQAAKEEKPLVYIPQYSPMTTPNTATPFKIIQTEFINPWAIEMPGVDEIMKRLNEEK